jgi:methylglutaconyl-CoA hydratase
MTDQIRLEVDARGIATLWLARPEKHNALSRAMLVGLKDAAAQIGADDAIRAVILAAEGRTFCAGGDLAWMKAQMAADPVTRRAEARLLAEALQALNTLPKPLIGRVHGNAFGGGVGLISVCDAALAAEGARFGLTETRLGLIPATIGPYVAARLGEARAREVFMSSRLFDAAEAVRLGLLTRRALSCLRLGRGGRCQGAAPQFRPADRRCGDRRHRGGAGPALGKPRIGRRHRGVLRQARSVLESVSGARIDPYRPRA